MSTEMNLDESTSTLDREEQDRLLNDQLPDVRCIARRIHDRLPRHIPLDDLVHAGVLGLIDAVHKYDPARNVQFKHYAKFRIRGAILDSLRELDWSPRDLRRKARLLEEADHKLRNQLNRAPTDLELAAEVGIPLEDYQDLLAELRGLDIGSLREEAGSGDERWAWCAYRPEKQEDDAYLTCLRSETKALLARAIGELPPKERQVLSLYYFEELTMKEIGAVLGVGESRICQIHSAAMVRLKARMTELTESRPEPKLPPPVLRPPLALASAGPKRNGNSKPFAGALRGGRKSNTD